MALDFNNCVVIKSCEIADDQVKQVQAMDLDMKALEASAHKIVAGLAQTMADKTREHQVARNVLFELWAKEMGENLEDLHEKGSAIRIKKGGDGVWRAELVAEAKAELPKQ